MLWVCFFFILYVMLEAGCQAFAICMEYRYITGGLPEEEACGKSSFFQSWSFGALHFSNPGLVSSVLMGVTLSGTHHQPVRLTGWRNNCSDETWDVRRISFSVIWYSFLFLYRNTHSKMVCLGEKKGVILSTSLPDENRYFASLRVGRGLCEMKPVVCLHLLVCPRSAMSNIRFVQQWCVLPCNSLHWVSKELVPISASSKDLSALQFFCKK